MDNDKAGSQFQSLDSVQTEAFFMPLFLANMQTTLEQSKVGCLSLWANLLSKKNNKEKEENQTAACVAIKEPKLIL